MRLLFARVPYDELEEERELDLCSVQSRSEPLGPKMSSVPRKADLIHRPQQKSNQPENS
jgi:hypothetical protein